MELLFAHQVKIKNGGVEMRNGVVGESNYGCEMHSLVKDELGGFWKPKGEMERSGGD